MNFFKLYIGDYQRDTAHLTMAEHGAYMLMLGHYYATEKPLPMGKALYRLLRAETKIDREAVEEITRQFWITTPQGLTNERADKEIKKAEHQRLINQAVGKRGGRPKKTESVSVNSHIYETESVNESITETEPINNPNHSHNQRKEKQPPPPPAQPEGFAAFWSAYPRKVGKPSALRAWKKLGHVNGLLPTILQALEHQSRSEQWAKGGGQFVPHPSTWINDRRWESELLTASGVDDVFGRAL